MDIKTLSKNTNKIAKIAIVIIFLALIRTLIEPLRLQYSTTTSLTYEQIKPFLIGGLISAVGLLIMIILFFYKLHKVIIAICILTIVLLLIIKKIYLLP